MQYNGATEAAVHEIVRGYGIESFHAPAVGPPIICLAWDTVRGPQCAKLLTPVKATRQLFRGLDFHATGTKTHVDTLNPVSPSCSALPWRFCMPGFVFQATFSEWLAFVFMVA